MELVPQKIGDFEDQDLLKHLFPTEKNVPAGASLLSKICDPARLSALLPDLPVVLRSRRMYARHQCEHSAHRLHDTGAASASFMPIAAPLKRIACMGHCDITLHR